MLGARSNHLFGGVYTLLKLINSWLSMETLHLLCVLVASLFILRNECMVKCTWEVETEEGEVGVHGYCLCR